MSAQPAAPAARLVEASQCCDVTREELASALAQMNDGQFLELAAQFRETRISIHRCCNFVCEVDPSAVERLADILCGQRVSRHAADAAQKAMLLQRERGRLVQQRACAGEDELRYAR